MMKLVKSIKEQKQIKMLKGRGIHHSSFLYELSIFKYKFPSFPKTNTSK